MEVDDILDIEAKLIDNIIQTIRGFSGANLIRRVVKRRGDVVFLGGRYKFKVSKGSLYIIGFGKASGSMAEGIEDILGDVITHGYVIVPRGTKNRYKVRRVKLLEGTHPLPSEANLEAARRILNLVKEAGKDDIIITLISGGGSALFTYPLEGVTLDEMVSVTKLVMEAGADIHELNAVRKHLSMVKGGRLAKYAYPARVYSLILSDVVGDPIDVIASGPTAPDTTTFRDAYNVLRKYNLIDKVPSNVIKIIQKGLEGSVDETPKPGDRIFKKIRNIIIGNNRMVIESISKSLIKDGFRTKIISTFLEGEAREVGKVLAGIVKEVYKYDKPFKKPVALLFGGETTVTVRGEGVGGRNQELVLSTSIKIRGYKRAAVVSVASDGIDGNSPAAGAYADGSTYEEALSYGMNPEEYLLNNDSYTFFKKLGRAIVTGYTDTNVNDITCLYIS